MEDGNMMTIWMVNGYIYIENMKYKKRSLLYYKTFCLACRQGKEECRQEAGRNQAGGRQGIAVAGQSMPGQGRNPQKNLTARTSVSWRCATGTNHS